MEPERVGVNRSRVLAVLAVSSVLSLGSGCQDPVPPAGRAVSDVVAHEVTLMVREGTDGYVAPSDAELSSIGPLAEALLAGRGAEAGSRAAALGYELVNGIDVDGRRFTVAREPEGNRRGWATMVVAQSGGRTVVEVPHPWADRETETVGLALFRSLGARVLLIGGAHSAANADGSADPVHQVGSAFHAAHVAMATQGLSAVQLQGFSTRRHPALAADVMVSAAQPVPTPIAESVAAALRSSGLDVCLFGPARCDDLGGRTNEQGRASIAAGTEFVIVEFSTRLRQRPDWVSSVVGPVTAAVASGGPAFTGAPTPG